MKPKLLSCLMLVLLIASGCSSLPHGARESFYNYRGLAYELKNIRSPLVRLEVIGKTYEGRNIFCVKVGRPTPENKPALMAIFAEHSGEHDTTRLAMGFLRHLLDGYGKDREITAILDKKEVYIVPMMNPDGVDYDLSGEVKPFSWRKNRRPTIKDAYGVDLNRNWGYMWDAPVPGALEKQLNDPRSPYYHGDSPFSEPETQAIRDFLSTHRNIEIFVDYHSGYAGFMQGGVGFPFSYTAEERLRPEHRRRYEKVAQRFAGLVTSSTDSREGFVVSQARDAKEHVIRCSPIYLKPVIGLLLPESTLAPGASGDWVYGELGVMAFCVEIMRDAKFLRRLPESMDALTGDQLRGFIYLLEELSTAPPGSS